MSEILPPCPLCSCEFSYEMGDLLVCPECANEWSVENESESSEDYLRIIKDSAGNVLVDGDTVTITKDLKVKGSSTSIKVGTKVRNIRLVNGADGHDLEAKVEGFGSMMLKSSVVKKVL